MISYGLLPNTRTNTVADYCNNQHIATLLLRHPNLDVNILDHVSILVAINDLSSYAKCISSIEWNKSSSVLLLLRSLQGLVLNL